MGWVFAGIFCGSFIGALFLERQSFKMYKDVSDKYFKILDENVQLRRQFVEIHQKGIQKAIDDDYFNRGIMPN